MIRFNEMGRERIIEVIGNHNAIVLQQEKLHGVFFNRFNVGLMLLVCVHISISQIMVDMKSLACASDRGRETHRSENVHPVKGSISLATVSPTPFSEVYITLLKTVLLHGFNVVLADGYVGEGAQ
ncbi:hypothetical protein OI450_06110 [Pectobacterium cacticida]|uniref:Uncharacterized protein n=1 Tax=Pectobacterium cacticida TaxID=69221 RepID=A0ABZ2G7D3_9GAMM|nr:hypothetical protein [Pectobacterium cacticida]UYX07944.1 hypothetical protein OI450_06110 [Pectobacterium cacticida]